MFKRSFDALGMEFIGAVTAEAYDIGDAENDNDALTKLSFLAAKLQS